MYIKKFKKQSIVKTIIEKIIYFTFSFLKLKQLYRYFNKKKSLKNYGGKYGNRYARFISHIK